MDEEFENRYVRLVMMGEPDNRHVIKGSRDESHVLWMETLSPGDLVRYKKTWKDEFSPNPHVYVGESNRPAGLPIYSRVQGPWCELRGPRGGRVITPIWNVAPLVEESMVG